ncbi:hypothetical protein BGZ95_008822 [Linnemannia exigua]|uniref:Uncharacterized protein n=1 Tax=Linnemannia exigua TaxID=604196 RepID=A0AAD4H751_9FUNG|nr:hypothetical protein BGZ95_008822 [Linnemannia exigua]
MTDAVAIGVLCSDCTQTATDIFTVQDNDGDRRIDLVSTIIESAPHGSRSELEPSSDSLCDLLEYDRWWKEWQDDMWSKLDLDFIMMDWEEEEIEVKEKKVDAACDEFLEYECGMIDDAIELLVSVTAQMIELDLEMVA